MTTKLHGCIPIIVTPFNADGSLDLGSLEREVEYVIGEGASGVAALALASEGYKLTEHERDEVARTVVSAAAKRVHVVISADGSGTAVAVERAARMARHGADALMVLPPAFIKPDQAGLIDYYTSVAAAAGLPIIIQDAPQLTGVSMTAQLWATLADRAPEIQYVKAEGTPQGPTLTAAMEQSGGKLSVFCGWGGLGMLDAMERGAAGSMPAPNFTRLYTDIQRLWERGDIAMATDKFNAALPFLLWSMQTLDYSVITAKTALHRLGVLADTTLRQPAATLDPVLAGQLDRFIAAHP